MVCGGEYLWGVDWCFDWWVVCSGWWLMMWCVVVNIGGLIVVGGREDLGC